MLTWGKTLTQKFATLAGAAAVLCATCLAITLARKPRSIYARFNTEIHTQVTDQAFATIGTYLHCPAFVPGGTTIVSGLTAPDPNRGVRYFLQDDCVLQSLNASRGQIMASGAALFTFYARKDIYVEALFDANEADNISVGDTADVLCPHRGHLPGRVTAILRESRAFSEQSSRSPPESNLLLDAYRRPTLDRTVDLAIARISFDTLKIDPVDDVGREVEVTITKQ